MSNWNDGPPAKFERALREIQRDFDIALGDSDLICCDDPLASIHARLVQLIDTLPGPAQPERSESVEAATSSIPGSVAKHCVVTDECRNNRGDFGAFEEAMTRIWQEYRVVARGWGTDRGVQIHLVLTVERPGK